MLLKTHSFEFGEFLLNPKEKILLRGGEPLSITPKAFQLLSVLVENHGHLVEKENLIKAVWADSFVEEGNLTFTIRLLRKALGDSTQNPRFIETVPKHGYRFIADVRSVAPEETDAPKFFSAAAKIAQPPLASAHRFVVEQHENVSAAEWQTEPEKKSGEEAILQFVPPPLAPRSLFGRDGEITLIEKMLCREDVRLVTLTGIGGSGKTSLARVIAGICSAHFPDGVFFVELAPIFNSDLVVAAIANTLDVKESSSSSLLETLQTFLRTRRILLVLDNFEQVAAAAPLLKKILAATVCLKVLVTSRAALHLSIENEMLVPPLAVPSSDFASISIAELENYPSIRMFVERACAVEPSFILADENAAQVAEICVRLSGLPLAIELAAARTKLLKPAAMLRRLENRLQILTSRTTDLPARQQTMRDTIAWSYDLLDEREKTLFRRLAVFAGGFTVEAAEAICGEEEIGGTEVLDELEVLVGSNLLQKTDDRDGETCLLLLEIIREYAAERLAQNPSEESAARRRHADFYLDYAKKIEREVMGAQQAERLNQMEAERDNFRAAMDWSRKTGDGEYELKLAAALASWWTLRGYLSEGIERLNEALERNPSAAPAVRAKALAWLGQLIWVKGDYVTAIAVCENGLTLARRVNYPIVAALSLFVLGMSHWYKYSDAEKSIACLEESLSLYRELRFDAGIVFTLVVLAAIRHSKNDLPQAERLLKESLAVAKQAGNNLMLSIAMVNYGRLEIDKNHLARAKNLCQESLRLRGELADSWGLVQCLEPLAVVALKENDPRRAAKMLGAIDVLLESLGAAPPLIFRADHEPSAAAARAALDAETFADLFTKGRKMSLSEIVRVALEESSNSHLDADFLKTETHFSSVETAASTDDLEELSAPLRLTSDFNPLTRKWSWLTAAFFIVSVIAFVLWYALT